MNYGIPAYLSLPLLGLICPVTVGRLIAVRATLADRRVNTALVFAAMCCILRDGAIQSMLIQRSGQRVSAALLDQLSDHAVMPATAALFLLAYGWVNHSEPRYLAQVVYVGTTVYVILAFALGITARSRDISLDIHSGWAVVAYSSSPVGVVFVELPFACGVSAAILIAIACARELRRPPNRRAAVISAGIALVAVGAFVQTANISIAAYIAATGRHNAYIEGLWRADRFSIVLFAYVGAAIAAVPLGARTLERLGWDKYSLRRKRLLPLWRDLTTACPEIVYLSHRHIASNRSRYLLHRTVIEIRDCILILSRYASHRDETVAGAVADPPALRQAVKLALAWSVKTSGEPPSDDFTAQQSAATELPDEIEELSTLAGHWAPAKALAADIVSSRAPT